MKKSIRVRPPAVAGTFYPGDPGTLRNDIEEYLANAEPARTVTGRPAILIEPHAGYMYSGQIAAYGYRLIADRSIKTVAVISPSHMEHFSFVSVFDGDAYETPLGTIDVDKTVAKNLAEARPEIRLSERGHLQHDLGRQEHALEVQLPFLQTVLEDFKIVPIVMGDQSWDYCQALGESLAPFLANENFVVVVSSDLSHFYSYDA
ncbi:MAG: AmmeMemoRadiSam system protein B, partial [Candidatus Latescibacterota bacterium]